MVFAAEAPPKAYSRTESALVMPPGTMLPKDVLTANSMSLMARSNAIVKSAPALQKFCK